MPHTFGGALAIDASRSYRGLSSLHSHIDATATPIHHPRASIVTYRGLDEPVIGTLYIRVWAYFQTPMPEMHLNQIVNLVDDEGMGIAVGARYGVIATNDYTSSLYAESSTVPLPLDRWTCLVLAIPSGSAGTTRVYVDGTEVHDVALAKSMRQPPPTHLLLGTQSTGEPDVGQPAANAWLDELILSGKPVSCDD